MDLMTPTYYVDVRYDLPSDTRWSCVHTCPNTGDLGNVLESVEHWKAKGYEVRVRMRSEQVIL